MTEKPPVDEPGADERFGRGIANALRMPPKLRKPPVGEAATSERPKSKNRRS